MASRLEIAPCELWAMSFAEFTVHWAAGIRRANPPGPAPMDDKELGDFFGGLAASGMAVQVRDNA